MKSLTVILFVLTYWSYLTYCEEEIESVIRIHTEPKNWHAAQEHCRAQGMQLLGEHLQTAYHNLESYWKTYNISAAWVGLSDLGEPGRWVWVHSGRDVSITYWAKEANQPKDRGSKHCVYLRTNLIGGANWYNFYCDEILPYACEEAINLTNSTIRIVKE